MPALARLRALPAHLPLWLRQAAKFLAVGVLNTAVDLGLYWLLTHALPFLAAHRVAAKGLSYGAGILNSFAWNKVWTFQSRSSIWATLIPFVLASLAGLGLNAGVMYLGLNGLHLPEIVALGLATASTLAWNFTISKFVIFRSPGSG